MRGFLQRIALHRMSAGLFSELTTRQESAFSLRLQGFASVEDHGIVKIVPEADAKLK